MYKGFEDSEVLFRHLTERVKSEKAVSKAKKGRRLVASRKKACCFEEEGLLLLLLGNEKKNEFSFCISLVFS